MTAVLVVDDDEPLRLTLERDLRQAGHAVHSAPSVADAIACLEREPIDVVVTDLRLGERDGIDLITALPRLRPRARPVLMSGYATARDHEVATELGAVRILVKPFTPAELREAIEQAVECGTGFRGSVHGLSLVDLLQMFHFARRSLRVIVGGPQAGSIHLLGGDIVHAESGDRSGEDALRALLGSGTGSLRTAPVEGTRRTITRSFDSLLLDLLRQLDEGGKGAPSVPPAGFPSEWPFAKTRSSGPPASPSIGGKNMGKIDDACRDVVGKVDGAVACGVVDLDTGMLLGIFNAAQYTQTLNEVVAAATMDMFRGPNVGRIEQMVRSHRGIPEDGAHYFEEIHVTSGHNYHFMKTVRKGKAVIVMVTKKSTNIGMGWAMLKSVIPEIEPHVP